jgi:hypothetical protein
MEKAAAHVARGHQNGQACRKAPPLREFIIDANIKQVVIVFHLIAQDFPLHLLNCANKMPRRRLVSITNGDINVVFDRVFTGLRRKVLLIVTA